MTGWSGESIIRSTPWESPPCTASWAARDPISWQRAALVLCFASFVLLVVPVYLLALELFGDRTAWLAALLVIFNPIVSLIAVNVLSESTFLLFWTFGLWGAVRFLREGRFALAAAGHRLRCAGLSHASRGNALARGPDGDLADPADASRAPGSTGPRWWGAIAFVLVGLVFLVGPYIALKGGVGTKPGIARVLGLAPRSQPLALERETPLRPDQTTWATYQLA